MISFYYYKKLYIKVSRFTLIFLKNIKNSLSFLTRFSIKEKADLNEDIAPNIWVFPIIGMMIGLIFSIINMIVSLILPMFLVGFLTLGFLIYITGGHHCDGLFDLGDGLMVMGSPKHKLEVMHDSRIGVGGVLLGFTVLLLTGISISYSNNFILLALILSEISAKFSMVAACSLGRSAETKTIDKFIKLNTKKHMIKSLTLSMFLILCSIIFINIFNIVYENFFFLKLIFIKQNYIEICNIIQVIIIISIFIIGSIIPMIFIIKISNNNFNGLTGDCLGALNEITRLFVLILLLSINSIGYI